MVCDIVRCEFNTVLFKLLDGGIEAFTKNDYAAIHDLAQGCAKAACISLIINLIVSPKWYKRKPFIWAMLVMEYELLKGLGMLKIYNKIESKYNGNAIYSAIAIFV